MKFLIAPNALKGSLSSIRAATIIAETLQRVDSNAETYLCPIADGGNGTLDCLIRATEGHLHTMTVRGPLPSRKVTARWGVLGDGTTAVIEMAEAAGLHLLQQSEYDVFHTSTVGVGELIGEAMSRGYRRILIGLGGSATNDGGIGCARALGVKFIDNQGEELNGGGIDLARIDKIDYANVLLAIKDVEFVGLSDVSNVLCGPRGAAHTFAAQKGATANEIGELDKGLRHYASIIERDSQRDISNIPGSGAAGGLGAGLIAFLGATIVSGIDFVLDALRFDSLVQECDCIITAEGAIDAQTTFGKGVEGISRRAHLFNKPVHVLAGRIDGNTRALQQQLGLASLSQISPNDIPRDVAMRNAEIYLSKSVESFFLSIKSEK